jgi:hypothetical protein
MAQQINDNYRLHAPKLLDDRSGPYDSLAEALTAVPEYQREQGLVIVVLVAGEAVEYWFKDGIADLDLVVKSGGGGYEPKNSIEVDADELQLVGDELAPGNNKVYGTDALGAKGWKDDPAGGTATPEYYPINTVVYYDDGKVKQVKTDIGGGLFIDKRVEYADTGDEIGKAILAEIKDESVSPALWKSITYNYTDGVLTSTTVADIVAWTISV